MATGPRAPWMLEVCFGCHLSIVVLLPNVNKKGEVELLRNFFFWCLKGCDGWKIVSIVLIIREEERKRERERERERGREGGRERKTSAKNSISYSLPMPLCFYVAIQKRAIMIIVNI